MLSLSEKNLGSFYQCWKRLGQDKISASIDEFRKRLKLVIDVNGGHFESRLL